jgi:hypothetical protein
VEPGEKKEEEKEGAGAPGEAMCFEQGARASAGDKSL